MHMNWDAEISCICRLTPFITLFDSQQNVAITLLLYMWEVPDSNLGPKTSYCQICQGFLLLLQANAMILP